MVWRAQGDLDGKGTNASSNAFYETILRFPNIPE